MLVFRKHGDLNQHAGDVVSGLKSLEVNCHVGRHLTTLLLSFLFRTLFEVLVDWLGKQLSEAGVLEDFNEDFVRLLYLSKTEES